MKRVNNQSSKTVSKGKYRDFTSIERQSITPCRDSKPDSSIFIGLSKRESCPFIKGAQNSKVNPLPQDQSRFARISTKGVYQSRNEMAEKQDWKILTLRQIKDLKDSIIKEEKMKKNGKEGIKIHVSVSKRNQSLRSSKICGLMGPKLSQIGGKTDLLKILSNRKIVETVEHQLQQKDQKNRFFCT